MSRPNFGEFGYLSLDCSRHVSKNEVQRPPSQETKTGVSDGPNTFWRAGVARGKSTTTANSSETPRASRRVVTCQQLPASVSFLKHAARQNNTNRAAAEAHRRNVFPSNALRRDNSAVLRTHNCLLKPALFRLVAIRCKRHFRALPGHTVLGGIEQPSDKRLGWPGKSPHGQPGRLSYDGRLPCQSPFNCRTAPAKC